MEMKLELVPVPVSDVDRSRDFYTKKVGFHKDVDMRLDENTRFVQLTPPGSACSIAIGEGLTDHKPGSIGAIIMVVRDIERAYADLSGRGVNITRPKKMPWGAIHADFSDPDGNSWSLQQSGDTA